MNNGRTIAGLGILAALVGVLVLSRPLDAGTMARAVIKECAESATGRAACYEEKVSALYPEYPVPAVFDVVREVRRQDPSYQFCHVLAHKIGERVVAEDPSRWVDAISLNPADGMCSNGFVHGVVGGRFRAEVLSSTSIEALLPDFTRACEPRATWNPSDLDRAICYHGMGHLYDFITDADVPRALALCSQTTPEEYERVCIEGVFMQIYQPLEPDDYELINRMAVKPTKETVRIYCASYIDPEYVGACLRESWPFFDEDIRNGTASGEFCAGQPDATRTEYCYQSISSIVGRMSLGDPSKAVAACSNFLPEWRQLCYGYSAEAVLEEDRSNATKAIELCSRAGKVYVEGCLEYLISHARFLFGDNAQQRSYFCAALPAAIRWQCLREDV
ncbi:MAG TPA: hypothetical protein VJJ20_03765 [Candidatus Paceibacterota bacterium]